MKEKGMKRGIFKLFGVIAFAAIVVFSMTTAACGGGGKSGSGSAGGKGGGTFTLKGIPSEYNGMYAFLEGGSGKVDEIYYGFETIDSSTNIITLPGISNGKVSIPMWNRFIDFKRLSNDKTFDFWVNITNSSEIPASGYSVETSISFKSVKFSKGSAARSWKDGK
jgi:hypothetical protein